MNGSTHHDLANYRPISFARNCYFLLEHKLLSHINAHLNQFNILTDAQQGFHEKRFCDTQRICTIDDLAQIAKEIY